MVRELELHGEAFTQRLAGLNQVMARRGLEGLIVFGLCPWRMGNLTYLTDFRPGPACDFGFHVTGYHALILAGEGPGLLVSPMAQAGEGLANVAGLKSGADFSAELAAAVREKGLATAKLGVAGSDLMPASIWLALDKALAKSMLEPADELLWELRAVKSPQEVELLEQAAGVGRQAILAGMDGINPGANERQLELRMRSAAYEAGAEAIAGVAVMSGPMLKATGLPPVSGRVLERGDLVTLHIRGWRNGYAFSTTKMAVAGKASQHQDEQLQHAEETIQYMVETLQPNRAVGYVTSMHGGQTILPTAHGIGLEFSEHPWIITGPVASKPVVRPNMVLCVEPILVDAKLGTLRSSQIVWVTGQGPRRL